MTALRNATPTEELQKAAAEATGYGSWSLTDMLLAELIDLANWLKWAKTEDASKRANMPKPYPRPGVEQQPSISAEVIDLFQYMREHNGAAPPGYVALA